MEFGSLPPEIDSARVHASPGSAPLLATASAWDGLAAELHTMAAAYQSVTSEVTSGPWQGPASIPLASAATPYVWWLTTTAIQAEQAAAQSRAAADAYEAAHAMTLPPIIIAANSARLTSLVAANVLGRYAPANAAAEFHCGEMWVQHSDAIYGYADTSGTYARSTFTASSFIPGAAKLTRSANLAGPEAGAGGQEARSLPSTLGSTGSSGMGAGSHGTVSARTVRAAALERLSVSPSEPTAVANRQHADPTSRQHDWVTTKSVASQRRSPRLGAGIPRIRNYRALPRDMFDGEARLSWVLAWLAGLVGAVAFTHSAGYFVTFMTGNTERAVVGMFIDNPWLSASAALLLVCFISGVIVGSLCRRHIWGAHPHGPIVLTTLSLTIATVVDTLLGGWSTEGVSFMPILFVAFGIGALNTTFVKNGEVSIALSYVTGTVVKLGQGIERHLSGGTARDWLEYFLLYASFVVGAAVGGCISLVVGGAQMLAVAMLVCALTTGYTYFYADRHLVKGSR